jgi:hypothetical protein
VQSMNDRRHTLLYSVLSVFLAFAGCSRNITQDEVIGIYIANHHKGLDEIELQRTGLYTYTCKLNDGKALKNSGSWSLHYENEEARITFNNFVFCLSQYGSKPAYWDVPVEKSWTGKLRLPLDRDLNYYFVRQKP